MSFDPPSKATRLRTLAKFAERVPLTLNLASALDAIESNSLPNKHWYLRSTSNTYRDRYELDDRIVGTTDLRQRVQNLEDKTQYVLQEYLYPSVSGVTYISDKVFITESLLGPCEPVLRHGANGYRVCRSVHGELVWTNFEADRFDADESLARFIIRKLKDENHSTFLYGAIVEWIIDTEGHLFLVDYKVPGLRFITNIGHTAPTEFCIYEKPHSAAVVPNTSIEYLDVLDLPQEGLRFASGSPLAHVCLEAFYRKIPTSVINTQIS